VIDRQALKDRSKSLAMGHATYPREATAPRDSERALQIRSYIPVPVV
jgi:hypothetical protein